MPASIHIDEGLETWVLTARGEFDYADCPSFRSHIQRVLTGMPGACIVDLSGIDYLDSSGLGMLVYLKKEIQRQGGQLHLLNITDSIRSVFQLTKLDDFFGIK